MKLYYNGDKCPKCGELTDHYNGKECRNCHLAKKREDYQMHRKKHIARAKEWNKAHTEERKEYRKKYYDTHTNVLKAKRKVYNKVYAEKINTYSKDYQNNELNSEGKTLRSIRCKSRYYLFNTLKQTKRPDYEVHHCFGYDDYTKFIYISKSLHLKIHQYLKDNNIDAKSDHYRYIVDMVNECTEYTYIHV